MDQELLEAFLSEITELNAEILTILKSLAGDINQPEEFLKFSNIIDRIYGTAATLGFDVLAKYCGELKTVTRLTGNSNVPRARQPVMKLMLSYTTHFGILKDTVSDPSKAKEFENAIKIDLKKMENLHNEIFRFVEEKESLIKA